MKVKKYLIIFLIIFFIPTIAKTQEDVLKFEKVTSEDESLKNIISAVFQDSKGFMWFGGENTLCRFDGYNSIIYESNGIRNTGFSGYRVNAITEDDNGFIWIGTQMELSRFDRKNNIFTNYNVDSNKNINLNINYLLTDSGYLYIAAIEGMYRLDYTTYKVSPLVFKKDSLIQQYYYRNIFKENDSTLWLSSSNGLIKYNTITGGFVKYVHNKNNPNSLLSDECFTCTKINDDLWIGHKNGITIFNTENNSYKRITLNYSTTSPIPTEISDIFQAPTGEIYIGTRNRGLFVYNPDKDIFYQYTNNPENPNSICSDRINRIYPDKSNVLWIATNGGGIDKIFIDKKKFHTLKHSIRNNNSLIHNEVHGITEDKDQNIWIATIGGISKYNPQNMEFTNYTSVGNDKDKILDLINWSVICDKSGNIWIGSDNGLSKYAINENKFYHYQHSKNKNSISSNPVYILYEDSKGNIWAGTQNGLNKLNPKTNKFVNYYNSPVDTNSLSNNTAWRIMEDPEGFIWIATLNGLNKLNPVTNEFIRYFNEPGNPQSLSLNNISDIIMSKGNKTIWITTFGGGLDKFNKEQNTFTNYGVKTGFSSNNIFSILEDNSGNFWMGCDNGLIKFNPKTLQVNNYFPDQGLQGKEFNFAKLKSTSGLLYFGGMEGINFFYPDSITLHTIIPNTVITGLKILNKPVYAGDTINGRQLLKYPIEETDKITLNYKDRSISIEFAALHYALPNKNFYKYKLEGFDKNWNDNQNKRFATYTNLAPGNYIFMVKACNFDGVWNNKPTKLIITVKPPYWETWLFRIAIILFIIIAVLVYLRMKINNVKNQNRMLEHNVKLRTEDLYESNTQLEEKQTELEIKQEEITSQRDAIEKQNKELEKLSIVASKTDNAVIIASRNGDIEWLNDGFTRLYGYTLNDLYKLGLNNFADFSKAQNIREIINNCLKSKKSKIYESLNHSKSGQDIWIQTTITPIFGTGRNNVKLIAIDSDISRLKFAESEIIYKNKEILNKNEEINAQKEELEIHRNHLEQLVNERTAELEAAKLRAEESDRLKSAFLANMSHEIRTPMNAIVGFTDLLNDPELTDETKKELTQLINYNSDSLLRLIDDIIDISKIEANQLVIEIKECKLEDIYDQLVPLFNEKKQVFRKDKIEILTNIAYNEKNLIINTDPFRLRQIIINLMDNALKFTEKGKIEIGYRKNQNGKNHEVTFFVKDTGIGLSDEQKKIIFNRFSKIEDNKKKLYRGAGLGLAISKNIIELLGGKIWVESKKDVGSTFYFTIPFTKLA